AGGNSDGYSGGNTDPRPVSNITWENIDVVNTANAISVSGDMKSLQNIHYNNIRIEHVDSNAFTNIQYTGANAPGSMFFNNVTVDESKGLVAHSNSQLLDL